MRNKNKERKALLHKFTFCFILLVIIALLFMFINNNSLLLSMKLWLPEEDVLLKRTDQGFLFRPIPGFIIDQKTVEKILYSNSNINKGYKKDINGDNRPERILYKDKIIISFSTKNFNLKHSLGLSNVSSLGMDDIDFDGCPELWYADSGKQIIYVVQITQHSCKIKNYRKIKIPNSFDQVGFFDIDNDGIKDLILTSAQLKNNELLFNDSTTKVFWIKLILITERNKGAKR